MNFTDPPSVNLNVVITKYTINPHCPGGQIISIRAIAIWPVFAIYIAPIILFFLSIKLSYRLAHPKNTKVNKK